ncbi:MAG: histidine phosphatase family protein [Nitriliruptoraceae bacterium]
MRRIVLVRHGESVWNAQGRIQGHSCGGLAEHGRAQAAAVAGALAAEYPDAHVVSSDLPRAAETAAAVAAALDCAVEPDPAVRERSFGRWEGRTRDQMAADDPDLWRRWSSGEDVVAEVGGEANDVFGDRVEAAFHALWERTQDGATTIVVTHGGTIWHGTHRVLRLAPATLGGVHNTSTTHLVLTDGGTIQCERWNEIGHLPLNLRNGRVGDGNGRVMGM